MVFVLTTPHVDQMTDIAHAKPISAIFHIVALGQFASKNVYFQAASRHIIGPSKQGGTIRAASYYVNVCGIYLLKLGLKGVFA